MTAAVSACLIVRDDPHLAKTVASLRPHVAEICIAWTPYPGGNIETIRRLADRVVEVPGEDYGRITDWSAARNASFALATQPWILWADSDDLVDGLERLPSVIEVAELTQKAPRIVCPYEYGYDQDTGECNRLQWRERIVRNDGRWKWEGRVHEVLVLADQAPHTTIREPRIVWKHQRAPQPADSGRTLSILNRWPSPESPKWNLDMGNELRAAGRAAEAAPHFVAYIEQSEWNEARAHACIAVADCLVASDPVGDHSDSVEWAERAVDTWPSFETRYALARMLALRGLMGHEASLPKAIQATSDALAESQSATFLAVDPTARSRCYELLHACQSAMCAEYESLSEPVWLTECLRRDPSDPYLRLLQLAHVPTPIPAVDVAIVCPDTPICWDATTPDTRGIGGSETAVVEMARRLVERGCRVRVYNRCARPGLYDGVEYRGRLIEANDSCDVLIAWRSADMAFAMPAKARLLWVHDTEAWGMTHAKALRFDKILALSLWHKEHLCKVHKLHPDHVIVTRNGIEPGRFSATVERDPHKVIYSSSLDRGLASLLEMWPTIRERDPLATLHVFYGADDWERSASGPHSKFVLHHILRQMSELPGVTYHGRVPQQTLAREMLSAGVWAFPTWFDETFCIGAAEAQAAGLYVVTTKRGALPETVRASRRATLIDGDWLSAEYQHAFVDAVIGATTNTVPLRPGGIFAMQDRYSWDGVADDWMTMLRDVLADAADAILPPYQGAA